MAEEHLDFIQDPTALTSLTKIHKRPILDCCFSPESDQILTASEDTTVAIWNLPPRHLEPHDESISDKHELVCYRLSEHRAPVMSVAMHRKLFLTASRDGRAKLWRLSQDTSRTIDQQIFKQPIPEPSTYACHQSVIRSVCFAPDARKFATASDDKSIKLWSSECRNKMIVSLLDGHTNWIRGVQWAKTNDCLLSSCGDDGKLCIWDIRVNVRQPPSITLSTKRRMSYNCLDWHPVFTHHIATGAQDSSCAIWDLRNKKQVQVYVEHNSSVNSVAFNPGGSLLLTGSSDKTSKIFDVCEGRNMFTLMSHDGSVTSVCFDSTGDLFATGSQDQTVTIWKRNFDTIKIVRADNDNYDLCDSLHEIELDAGSSIIPSNYNDRDRYIRNHDYVYGR